VKSGCRAWGPPYSRTRRSLPQSLLRSSRSASCSSCCDDGALWQPARCEEGPPTHDAGARELQRILLHPSARHSEGMLRSSANHAGDIVPARSRRQVASPSAPQRTVLRAVREVRAHLQLVRPTHERTRLPTCRAGQLRVTRNPVHEVMAGDEEGEDVVGGPGRALRLSTSCVDVFDPGEPKLDAIPLVSPRAKRRTRSGRPDCAAHSRQQVGEPFTAVRNVHRRNARGPVELAGNAGDDGDPHRCA